MNKFDFKKFLSIGLLVIGLLGAGMLMGGLGNGGSVSAQKVKQVPPPLELDSTYRLLVGKRGFYQLKDSEGGIDFNQFGQLEPFGRKVPAFISGLLWQRNTDGSLVFDSRGALSPLRNKEGTVLVCVTVLRPANKGGVFDLCGVPFSSREPGGFDIIVGEDLVGF